MDKQLLVIYTVNVTIDDWNDLKIIWICLKWLSSFAFNLQKAQDKVDLFVHMWTLTRVQNFSSFYIYLFDLQFRFNESPAKLHLHEELYRERHRDTLCDMDTDTKIARREREKEKMSNEVKYTRVNKWLASGMHGN